MLLKLIFVLVALAISTLASPLNMADSKSLHKRAHPKVNMKDYNKLQFEQIKQAHNDAIMMASKVVSSSADPDVFDPIFKKYFNIEDRVGVLDVFKQIVGPRDDCDGPTLLGEITAVKDYVEDYEGGEPDVPSCIEETLVVCPKGFATGALSKSFPDVPAVTCGNFWPRISRKINALGFVFLHEYTHWERLMSPAMKDAFDEKATIDVVIGPGRSELRKYKTATPGLIICPKAFYKSTLGDNPWANVPKLTCDSCYPRISYKMETLGHTLLYEYMHWETLMSPVIWPFQIRAAVDMDNAENRQKGYGPWEVTELRNEDKLLARKNADSYAWLATEVYWAQYCVRKRGPFTEARQRDN